MGKKEYLKKLSSAVRWRIPEKEAEEILADYEVILEQKSFESDAELVKDLGNPYHAAKLMCDDKAYRHWLIVFAILSACLLLPLFLLWNMNFHAATKFLMFGILIGGITLSQLYFHHKRKENLICSKLPRNLIFVLLAFLLIFLCVSGILTALFTQQSYEDFAPFCAKIVSAILKVYAVIAASAGIFGLYLARTKDYRWRSLYVYGLTCVILCVLVTMMQVTLSSMEPGWLTPYLITWCSCIGIGLIGTGASLC